MKKAIMSLVTAFALVLVANARISYEVSIKGALAKVKFRIIDQDGVPVLNAKIWGAFSANRSKDSVLVDGATNTNGEFTAQGKCNEFLRVDVTKEGYYHTEEKINFWSSKADPIVVDGRWQAYGETRTVVVERVRNPYAVKVFSGEQCHRKIPVFGQWLPFDMEVSDWLAPYGNGVHDDVLLRFEKKLTDKWYDFTFTMEASFTNNPYAGVYIKPLDGSSDLKTGYSAETNSVFHPNYTFLLESVSKKKEGLDTNSYLVFRTRTRVDENGKLVGAHYGKYYGSWRSDDKEMRFAAGCFNPVENDASIEGDQPLLYRIRNYKEDGKSP